MSTKYNGWTNYETWNLALWLDNDQGSHEYWREQAQDTYDGAKADKTFSRKENATFDLANRLKSETQENSPTELNGFYADMMNAALSEINYHEIAEHYLDDVESDEEAA